MIERIGGGSTPAATDPGAGQGDSYGQAADAMARAAGVAADKVAVFREALRAAVAALWAQYQDEPMPPAAGPVDPGV